MRTKRPLVVPLFVIVFLVAGCTSSGKDQADGQIADEAPVTIKIGIPSGWMTEEEMQRYITGPVSKKHPWITVEMVPYVAGKSLNELVTAGETPDIVIDTNIYGMTGWTDLGLTYSLTDLIEKHQMDLSRFEPESLDAVRAATQREDLVGIPYWRHFSALYYNKDIFDKFGVAYPKDGMTWEETYELAKQLTRLEGGIQYRGLEPNVTERMASQLSLPYVEPKTYKSLLNTEQWQKVLSFAAKVHQIPGNSQITYHGEANDLLLKGTLAMLASVNIIFEGNLYQNPDIWDIASYPTWPEAPGIGMRVDAHLMGITATSPHKDAAFLTIATVTSDEVQMDMSRQGRFSVLNNQSIRDAFGADLAFMQGKNIQAIYKTKPAKTFVPTKYDGLSMGKINTALSDIIEKGKDVNTALREAEESANKEIREREAGNP
ncbi:ABC transporter substrate-binding protein [Paenibacillus ginsengihumi]|mgnify:CR=1 FL=1|uniref:ABC transporter substrate-binding protein n=1 Tax=Paenibacillus ginsengihumi TaxID=431596 RepID=UPI000367C7F6|nr:extracellular solute-binding protein [Paenibacillus ginsengihumi]